MEHLIVDVWVGCQAQEHAVVVCGQMGSVLAEDNAEGMHNIGTEGCVNS